VIVGFFLKIVVRIISIIIITGQT